MTLKGGTSQACASCKYQRRKCTSRCPLAPYFPADQTKKFANAHKLFGVKKIQKILENLDPSQHSDAMNSIIFHANARDIFPVSGCWGYIRQLQYQIWTVQEELQRVLSQIEAFKQQQQQQQQQISSFNLDQDFPSQLELAVAPNDNPLTIYNHPNNNIASPDDLVSTLPVATQKQESYAKSSKNAGYSNYMDLNEKLGNCLWMQNEFADESNPNSMTMQSQFLPFSNNQESVHDYDDEIHPFFDSIDDQQSYIDSKRPYDHQSSPEEESLKDTIQSIEHVVENDLRNAAVCFSLTS